MGKTQQKMPAKLRKSVAWCHLIGNFYLTELSPEEFRQQGRTLGTFYAEPGGLGTDIGPESRSSHRRCQDQQTSRFSRCVCTHMGLSENSVALHPMVNGHYPY